jgi:hypothetical protein
MAKEITSKNIGGITDLVVLAPIKNGFITAFENITYETRLKLTAEALHKVRVSAREHELIAPFADTAERILSLLDFRIGIVDRNLIETDVKIASTVSLHPKRYMYLVATFDGPWEPYMRLIWKPLGPFLDLLLCNCEGYISAQEHSFAEYAQWVRDHQLDSAIFYSTTGLTVRDHLYLAKLEKIQRENDAVNGDDAIARMTHDHPEALARAVLNGPTTGAESIRLALEALTVLYRLADYYPFDNALPPSTTGDGEGRYLLRAAKDLLLGWKTREADLPDLLKPLYRALRRVYAEPLDWFESDLPPSPPVADDPDFDASEIQKGVLTSYDSDTSPITHGALLLMQISDPARARDFIRNLGIDWEGATVPASGHIYRNIAFTFEGLGRLELADVDLAAFPKEFRDGMRDRAPMIGDVRTNHPREWLLPERNWPRGSSPDDPLNPPIDPTEIDFVVQLRAAYRHTQNSAEFVDFRHAASAVYAQKLAETAALEEQLVAQGEETLTVDDDPLATEIGILAERAQHYGVTLLGLESMFRPITPDDPTTTDHFGFRDGISQPNHKQNLPDWPGRPRDDVRLGELLCGYRNDRGEDAAGRLTGSEIDYQFNGSFLVVRKMSQDRAALNAFAEATMLKNPDLDEEDVLSALVGRTRDGTPLISPASGNDFDYRSDPKGEQCPFASHIRRTNPRDSFQGRPAPRISRRGMSYGPRFEVDPTAPRGVMFMAYNASIAEQYEVIQRWINRGNSTLIASAQNDPLVGTAMEPGPRTFRFVAKNRVRRFEITKPFVGLEWGLYLFAPSKTALDSICDPALDTGASANSSIAVGQDIINRIAVLDPAQQPDEWKRLLEDFRSKDPSEKNDGPDMWAAIRDGVDADGNYYDGVLRLPLGVPIIGPLAVAETTDSTEAPAAVVLVGKYDYIMEVLSDAETYSVCEQGERAEKSFGAIFVAMDPGDRYELESKATNEIIWDYSEYHQEDAFRAAYQSAEATLNEAKLFAASLGNSKFFKVELRRQFLMPALGSLCTYWYDIPDIEASAPKGEFIELGGWGWKPVDSSGAPTPAPGHRKPRCPGDFMAPSRYSFYPRPTEAVRHYGPIHGHGLKAAAPQIVAKKRAENSVNGKISQPMFAAISDDDVLARNLIGIMEGMLPPTDGILRGIIYEWLDQETLWRHQASLRRESKGGKSTLASAKAALLKPIEAAMCKRPAPDLIYRTATCDAVLGGVEIQAGDTVILGLVSAMQASVAAGVPDVTPVFGGARTKAMQDPGDPIHACPARNMVMASVLGILSALLDSGRIEAQPSSLIVKISEYSMPMP